MERSSEYNAIYKYFDDLNKQPGGRSFDRIRELKFSGQLIYDFNVHKVSKNFKNLLINFIDMMNDEELEKYPYSKKFFMQNHDFVECYKKFSYEFGLFLNNKIIITPENNKIWFLFPLFFKEACKRYGIKPYASTYTYDLKVMLKKYIDLECGVSDTIHNDRDYTEYEENPVSNNRINYLKYCDYESYKGGYIGDDERAKNIMFVDAEKKVYDDSNVMHRDNTYWLGKDYGDRYGYDILVSDKLNNKEYLKEAKSSFYNDYFDLSEDEYKTMISTRDMPNTEYQLIKYKYNRDNIKEQYHHTYTYDKENNSLVCREYPIPIICEIKGYDCIENGVKKRKYRCTPNVILMEHSKKLIFNNRGAL